MSSTLVETLSFISATELENTIMDFIKTHNENKKPFVWTKMTEQILGEVGSAGSKLYLYHLINTLH